MKSIYLFVSLSLLGCYSAFGQSHEWQWAKTEVQPNHPHTYSLAHSVATDNMGNVLVTGHFFTDSITFGTYTLYNSDPSENTSDIYVAKYDPSGNVLWAKAASGTHNDFPYSVKTDKSGNVYIAGQFFSDSLSFGSHTIYNSGPIDTIDDIFVVKYSPTGGVLWAKSFGGDYFDGAFGLATDASNNVYVTGFFRSDSISFGPYKLYDANGGRYDNSFLVKCDSSGNVLWAAGSVSQGIVESNTISTDPMGNVFIAGRIVGPSATFGATTIQNQRSGEDDIFLVKYNGAGTVLWAKSAGGNFNDVANGVATDALGNAYITGFFNSLTAYFGTLQLNNDTTDATGDVFLAKYDANGNELWVNSGGGNLNDVATAIACDTGSNVYITGYYYSPTLVLSGDTVFNYNSMGNFDDIFMAKYDKNGNLLSTVEAGGDNYDAAFGIATDVDENVYLGGFYRSDNVYFGINRLNNSTSTHNSNSFIAKYSCIVPSIPTISVSGDTLRSNATSNNQWYRNGYPITNATNPIYIAHQPGTYTVEVVNGPTCRATSVGIATGVSALPQMEIVNLYPNPAIDLLTVEFETPSSDMQALIYDMLGNLVNVDTTLSADKVSLDVSHLAFGIYWLKLKINGGESMKKFTKLNFDK